MLRWLTSAGHAVSGGTLIFLTALITVEVVLRRLFDTSLLVVDELSGYLLVVLTFFGANHALRTGSLLRVDFIFNRLSPRGQRVADICYDIACGIFCGVLTWYFGRLVWSSIANNVVSSTMASTPMFIPQLAMPLGTGLMTVTFLLMAWAKATGRGETAEDERSRVTEIWE